MYASMSAAEVVLASGLTTSFTKASSLRPKKYLSNIKPSERASTEPFWSISNVVYPIGDTIGHTGGGTGGGTGVGTGVGTGEGTGGGTGEGTGVDTIGHTSGVTGGVTHKGSNSGVIPSMGAPGQPDVLEQYVTLFSEKFGFSE